MEGQKIKLNTIGKVISILELIRSSNGPLSIKEISEGLDLNKSSLHHHIKTLTEFGFLQQDRNSRKYEIGLELVRVGQSYLKRIDVRERGHFYLEELSKKLNETVHMLILDKDKIVYVDKVDVHHQSRSLHCSSFIGLSADVFSTASGKILLSYLESDALEAILDNIEMRPITPHTLTDMNQLRNQIALARQRGYAFDLEENAIGLQCIAVPILNIHSQCIAAISVSCPVSAISKEDLETKILQQLKETGEKISISMGYNTEI